MIDVSCIAFRRFLSARATTVPDLPDQRVNPLSAPRVEASGDPNPLPGSSPRPGGSAVEAGRSAAQSDPGDECDCAVCSSDLAGIVPCLLNEEI